MPALLLDLACTTCNQQVQDGIFDGRFATALLAMAAPFLVVWALVWVVARRFDEVPP